MTPRRVRALARKEFIQVFRDPRSLGMAVAIPILLLVLFGYALTLDVDRVPLVIWDQSGTPTSRAFVEQFAGSRYFLVRRYVDNYAAVERAIDLREALAALIVPPEFARQLDSGRPAAVQMIFDGSDSNTATIAMGYAEAVTQTYTLAVTVAEVRRVRGQSLGAPLDLRSRVWFNSDLESRNFIVPGLIAVIMMVIAALLTSLTVAREWERGTMEQLISTPVKASELILGKLLPYFAIGMFDVLLAVLMGQFVFRVPLRGSPALLFAMASVFLTGALALGLMISMLTRSQLVANQLAMVGTFLPAFLLSGFIYAIANMPTALQWVTYLVPARYFVTVVKGIYLKGIGLEILAPQAVLLVLYAAAIVLLTQRKFRKKLG